MFALMCGVVLIASICAVFIGTFWRSLATSKMPRIHARLDEFGNT